MRDIADLATRVAAQITGPVDLFAQSMGGIVAALTALDDPELVRHLVLSVTSGGIDMTDLGALDWRREFRASNPGLPLGSASVRSANCRSRLR